MNCVICSLLVAEGAALGNGRLIHPSCLQSIASDYESANRCVVSARSQVEALRTELQAQESFIKKVASFFTSGPSADQLTAQLNSAQENLTSFEKQLAETNSRAIPIFDLLLDYPPDWNDRRARVQERDHLCAACGSGRHLQAHHITPLARGGSNRIENLKLLCQSCHKTAHGGRGFSGDSFSDSLPFAQRVQTIESAISAGSDIEFLYRKPTDAAKKKRRVTPIELISMQHEHDEGMTLCLQGYCHTRKANRVFALKRMTGVKRI
jgi:hypothetical protein